MITMNKEKAHILVEKLKQGTNIALISDAGTPLISDQVFIWCVNVVRAGIKVVPLPVLVRQLRHYVHRASHLTVLLKVLPRKPRRVRIS